VSKAEIIQRLILGDLCRILRYRYGATLPDDDAGRDDLELLLRLAALSPLAADRKLRCWLRHGRRG